MKPADPTAPVHPAAIPSRALAVFLVAVLALAGAVASQPMPVVAVDEPVHDLGVVEVGATVRHTFVLRNRGQAPLEIVEVDPDCGCTVVDYDKRIAPGGSGKITASVDLTTFFGPIAKYLRVYTNDPATPELSLAVKVEVRPLVQVHPGYARFLTVTGEETERVDQVVWASDIENLEIEGARSPYRFVEVKARPATESEERSLGKKLRFFTERYPFLIHGLSLSIGSPAPLNETLLHDVRAFMDAHNIRIYSEHLSFCGDDGQLYDLMPIPFTEEAVHYVAKRIRHAQDILERRMAVENVSYYAPTDSSMSEAEFTRAVLEEADCDLLLDINNIIVNSINHRYDAEEFMQAMPAKRVRYFHIAGHYVEADDLRVDTHGDAVSDQAWDLLGAAYARFGPVPTLLERDFNFPPVDELMAEVRRIKQMQAAADRQSQTVSSIAGAGNA